MTDGKRAVLIVAILASLIAFLDGSIVNVALPAIERELGGSVQLQQWVVDAYLLTLGSLILLAGSFSDRYGRTRILRIGLIGFAVTSLIAAAAPSGELLVAARALQGAAAALLIPSSLAMLAATFKGPDLGKAIGSWTAWTGLAFLIGPVAGGVLVDTLGWRWVFGAILLPTVLALLLSMRVPKGPVPTAADRPRIDIVGAVLAAVGLAGPVSALIEGQQLGFTSAFVLTAGIIGLAALVAFVLWERRTPHPMLPPTLFRLRSFTVANLATIGVYGAVGLGPVLLTLLLQEVGKLPATVSAAVTLPIPIFAILLSRLFGGLSGKYGPRIFMTAGPLISGLGFLYLLSTQEPLNVWTQVLPGMILFGIGIAMTASPLTATVLSEIPDGEAGIASAVNNAVARVSGLVSVAFISLILGGTISIEGFHRGVITIAGLLTASALVAFVGLRSSSSKSVRPRKSRISSTLS
ncbi:MFS transporter [Leifsonia xyli]|uniref:MFS transporter n=1 Tax=Leifsonia xyli TaxID=1575 RepID=UPI003D66A8EC